MRKPVLRVFLNAPIKKQIFVDGGANPTGDVCAGQHFHGYVGMEKVAVDNIAGWITNSTS